jgi:hypothetical protein
MIGHVGRVDPAASAVAAAYADAPSRRHPLAAAAYALLAMESDQLIGRLTSPDRPGRVHIVFTTCPTPYGGAHELIGSVRQHRLLEVTTVATGRDRHHPLMGNEPGGSYDRFRGVHDVLGHAASGSGSTATASSPHGDTRTGSTARSPAGRSPPSCTDITASCGRPVTWPNPRRSSSPRLLRRPVTAALRPAPHPAAPTKGSS